jgi:hypothetical protein
MSGSVKGLASKRVHIFLASRRHMPEYSNSCLSVMPADRPFIEPSQELSDLLAHPMERSRWNSRPEQHGRHGAESFLGHVVGARCNLTWVKAHVFLIRNLKKMLDGALT